MDYDGESKTEVLRSKGSGSVQVRREKVPEPDPDRTGPQKRFGVRPGTRTGPGVRFGVRKKWPPNRTEPDPGIPNKIRNTFPMISLMSDLETCLNSSVPRMNVTRSVDS